MPVRRCLSTLVSVAGLVECGCGGRVPEIEGPTHPYMLPVPGCWRVYGEVLAREYSGGGWDAAHRLTVDAYAAQHPHSPNRRNRQSVALHLMSLCVVLERGATLEQATHVIAAHAATARTRGSEFPWLEPPVSPAALTVVEVAAAQDPREHVKRVKAWAASVWQQWEASHGQIREWLDTAAIDSASDRP